MYVIGTAGHVDHGKSTLVKALTGINPDRLREEQARQMTIELGFAWFTLPEGQEIGIVDVPGHRDFIDNMLAGVGGIDAVLFVIAVDEGIMPQTREHLAILDLLGIQRGIVVLTKSDLAPDAEWLDLITIEVKDFLDGSALQDSPIIPVSANSGQGLNELKTALAEILKGLPEHRDLGKPRLWIDRVFSLSGFGTVVTGTLQDGELRIGEEIEVLPHGIKARIRGLQTHKKSEQLAVPGSRVAVNLTGIKTDQIDRGNLLAKPTVIKPTQRIDAFIRMLPDALFSMKHDAFLKCYIGSAQCSARVRVIGEESIEPGKLGWVQLEFDDPIPVDVNDRFILRWPSPGATIAGGRVLNPHPIKRYRRFNKDVIAMFEKLEQGKPEDRILHIVENSMQEITAILAGLKIQKSELDEYIDKLISDNRIVVFGEKGDGFIASTEWVSRFSKKTLEIVNAFHTRFPLREGMPREELKNKLALLPKQFNAFCQYLVVTSGDLRASAEVIAIRDFQPRFTEMQQKQVDVLLSLFDKQPYMPPAVKECISQVGEETYHALIISGVLKQVTDEVVFVSGVFNKIITDVIEILHENKTITLAQVRDHFQTSRKYALALLEYMDTNGLTVRDGDNRRLADTH